ncbi:MAG: TonB-dependent receptor [Maricaulaceae bacterium]|nr:TonB-dependent receptor [Maricaulaceae bacterium]
MLCLSALGLFAAPAIANGTEDVAATDTVIIIGSRVPLPESEVTAAATLIDEADIEARGAVFVSDALRAVAAFSVSRSGPPGGLTQLRARGSEAGHVLVFVDGVQAASPFTGQTDFAHLLTGGVARIEALRGEQSALWGPDAIGGVVNIITADPGAGPGWRLSAEGGSFGTWSGHAAGLIALPGDGFLRLGAGAYETDGIDVSGTGGDTDGYANRYLAASAALPLGASLRLQGGVRAIRFDSQFDTDLNFDGRLEDADRRRKGDLILSRAVLIAEAQSGGVAWRHQLAAAHTRDDTESFAEGARTVRSTGNRVLLAAETTARFAAAGADHRLTLLAERQRDRLANDGGPGAPENQRRTITADALAFDYGLAAGGLVLSLSARRDFNDGFSDSTTWRAGAAQAFDAIGGRLRAAIGEGVRNPGLFELYGFFPDFFTGNPGLVPERSRGWDIGWEQRLGERASVSLTYFSARLHDEIFSDFSVFPATARNRDTVSTRRGVELEGFWRPVDDLTLRAYAAHLDAAEAGVREIRRPRRSAGAALDWRPAGARWRLGLAADHVGARTDTDFGSFQTVRLAPYTLVSGSFGWRVNETAELTLRGENLLNEDYQDVFSYAAPGRGLYLGLRLRG